MLEADVCIVGAGPAGITVAVELMRSDLRIVILEAGGERSRRPPRRYAGSSAGTRYKSLRAVRRQGLGGTSADWLENLEGGGGVRCLPLQPIDFEEREGSPGSGWPFGAEALDPYYPRAHRMLGLGAFAYRPEEDDARRHESVLLPGSERVETALFRFAEATCLDVHVASLLASPNVTVVLGARVVEIETDDRGENVTAVRARSPRGEVRARARLFVLAAGGIENARLLLASRRIVSAGLGNRHDHVGRFFMEHLVLRRAQIVPADDRLWDTLTLYRRRRRGTFATLGALRLTEATRREERLGGVVLSPFDGRATFTSQSVHAWAAIVHALAAGRAPEQPLGKLLQVLADPLPAAHASWLWIRKARVATMRVFGIHAHFEQSPDPENRILLSSRRDPMGVPRPRLQWRIGDVERRSVVRTLEIVDAELRRAGLGEVWNRPAGEDVIRFAGVTHHHMGTTRMHRDPRHGVVDENCRIHDVSNLFVAGSSVFPTGGAASATLTLVALAIRLADHLAARLASPAPHGERGMDAT